MSRITRALFGVLFVLSLVAAPGAAKSKKDCCSGASCCNGQSCCRK